MAEEANKKCTPGFSETKEFETDNYIKDTLLQQLTGNSFLDRIMSNDDS